MKGHIIKSGLTNMEQNGLGSMLRQAAGDPGQERAEGAVDPQEGFQVKASSHESQRRDHRVETLKGTRGGRNRADSCSSRLSSLRIHFP